MRGPKTTLSLERLTQTENAIAGFEDTWTAVTDITGVLTDATGRENIIRNKVQVTASHRFYFDPVSGVIVTELDRFVLGERVFEIVFVTKPLNTERAVVCMLQEQK